MERTLQRRSDIMRMSKRLGLGLSLGLGGIALCSLAACGSSDASSRTTLTEGEGELFVQADPTATDGALRIVRMNLSSGESVPVTPGIPGSHVKDSIGFVRQFGSRVLVQVNSTAPALFAFDASADTAGSWRMLMRSSASSAPLTSSDFALVGVDIFTAGEPDTFHTIVKTYAGATLIDEKNVTSGRFALQGFSSTSDWIAYRPSDTEFQLRHVNPDGTLGAVQSLKPNDGDAPVLGCSLSTSLVLVALDGSYWQDTSFAPLSVPGFDAHAFQRQSYGSQCNYQDERRPDGTHAIAAFADQSLEPLFTTTSPGDVVSIGADVYIQLADADKALLVSRATNTTLATYAPTPMAGGEVQLTLTAHSFGASKTMIWSSDTYTSGGDESFLLGHDVDLLTVNSDGAAKPPVRLWSQPNPSPTSTVPVFRLSRDGSRAFWVENGAVHVIDVDSGHTSTLDAPGVVNVAVDDRDRRDQL